MAMTFTYKGRRIGQTYIKCECVGITNECDWNLKYIYKPVCGDGEITLEMPDKLGDNVVPMEHLRLRERIGILEELKYPVEDICRIIGAPEYLVKQYLYKGYAGLDHDGLRNERHKLYTQCTELREENAKLSQALESEKADSLQFEHRGKELTEKSAKLTEALDSARADIRYLEDRRKALLNKNGDLTSQIDALECKIAELTKENARLWASLKSEEEANDILTKRIDEANNEIDDLKERYRTLQAECVGISGTSICCAEEKENLTKQLSDLRSAYDRIYRSRDEHIKHVAELTEENAKLHESHHNLEKKADELAGEYIRVCKAQDEHVKHINALEHQIEDLEHEKKVTADMYDLANKTLCEVRAENAKLKDRISAYAVIH